MNATDDRVLEILTSANPHPRESIAAAAEDPHARAMLTAITAQAASTRPDRHPHSGRARAGRRVLAPAVSLVVVVAVVALALHGGAGHRRATTGPDATAATTIVLRLQPTPQVPRITRSAVAEELQILRARLRSLGTTSAPLTRHGDEIVVHSKAVARSRLARTVLTRDPQLALTDWEQNLIAPDGRTVASQLPDGNRQAGLLSQGRGGMAGAPDSGALALYRAVRLASRQPWRAAARTQTRRGAESFAFAPAGNGRCSASRTPCWAAGPSTTAGAAAGAARRAGVRHPLVLTVPQGTIVVRATTPDPTLQPDYRDAGDRYYVLRDAAALTGLDLRRATRATSAGGSPDVNATLTPAGTRAFQALTGAVAHRGMRLDATGSLSFQHFAVIINGAIMAVPQIDYRQYPAGVVGSSTIQIDGGLSRERDAALAAALRLRTLPLKLTIAPGG